MPLLIDQQQTDHAVDVITGKVEMLPFYKELKKYINDKYEINVLDFCIEEGYDAHGVKAKKRIIMLVSRMLSYQRNSHRKKLEDISKKMLELNKEYGFIDEDNIDSYIGFYDFRPIYRQDCVEKASEAAISYIKQHYKEYGINDIICSSHCGPVVFYNYDSDVADNNKNGITEQIKLDFFKMVKEHDVLDSLTEKDVLIFFDSNENLDKNYKGNLWEYYR